MTTTIVARVLRAGKSADTVQEVQAAWTALELREPSEWQAVTFAGRDDDGRRLWSITLPPGVAAYRDTRPDVPLNLTAGFEGILEVEDAR